jgi:predicted RNA polymerase sigma factor
VPSGNSWRIADPFVGRPPRPGTSPRSRGGALRLSRMLRKALPDDSEEAGLLALMLLVHARHPARTVSGGSFIPVAEQDRSLWDRDAIDEGVALVTHACLASRPGRISCRPRSPRSTTRRRAPTSPTGCRLPRCPRSCSACTTAPWFALNHAVAVAMVAGPRAGLDLLSRLEGDPGIKTDRRFHAVRAHLLERDGDHGAALEAYQEAARRTTDLQQRRYLNRQVARLRDGG